MTSVDDLLRLSPGDAAARLSADADDPWVRRFVEELDRLDGTRGLERFLRLWDLSTAGGARCFRISRQAFGKWLRFGPPADRSTEIADVAAATDLLDRYLRRDRIAAVVRRPAPALGGESLLSLLEAGRSAEVLSSVRDMFDLRRAQP